MTRIMNISVHAEPARQVTTASSEANEGIRIDARNVAETAGDCSVESAVCGARLDEARQLVKIAIDLQRDGKSRMSGRYAKRALSLFARESQTDNHDAVLARLCLADSRFVRGDLGRAETDYRAALTSTVYPIAATTSFDVQNVKVQAIRGLARVALARGETLQAELQLLSALDMAELKAASAHESRAMLMDDLGTLYRQTGRYDEASRVQHLALTIIEETGGIERPEGATILEHLAMLEYARGQFMAGERIARRAAAIEERIFGRGHPRVAHAFVVLASMLEGQGRWLEANLARRTARLMAQRWFGDDLEALAGSGLTTATTHSRSDRRNSEERFAGVRYA